MKLPGRLLACCLMFLVACSERDVVVSDGAECAGDQDPESAYREASAKIEEAGESKSQNLRLEFLGLTSLPPEIGELKDLRHLSLYCNRLETLPPEIGRLEKLVTLDLGHNKLTSLPPEIGRIRRLFHLDAKHNSISSLPPEIGALTNLHELWIQENKLTTLPPEIGNLTNLRDLNLSYNELASLPPEIGGLKGLVNMHLNDNRLSFLPPEIGKLEELYHLNMGGNQFQGLPAELETMKSLRTFLYYRHELAPYSAEIANVSNLQLLRLHDKHHRLGRSPFREFNVDVFGLFGLAVIGASSLLIVCLSVGAFFTKSIQLHRLFTRGAWLCLGISIFYCVSRAIFGLIELFLITRRTSGFAKPFYAGYRPRYVYDYILSNSYLLYVSSMMAAMTLILFFILRIRRWQLEGNLRTES